jgi:heme exporter protein C
MGETGSSSLLRLAAWKWACMILLLYVFIAGWLVPLNPGIIEVSPAQAKSGQLVSLEVTGYNSSYGEASSELRAWLRFSGDTVIQAKSIKVVNDRKLIADFQLPNSFPVRQEAYPLTLVVDHPVEGASVLPNAIFISPAETVDSTQSASWYSDKVGNIHEKAGIQYPFRNILSETIRNTYFHVPMWFCMIVLFGISAWYSLQYYRHGKMADDSKSIAFVKVGLLFGVLGMVTGMLWAKHTWNAYWSWDVKQNMSAIALLIYAALMVMRSSVEDDVQRARLTAGYNMFAFVLLIPLLFIIPRMTDSLHPGSGGNPAMGGEDLDNTMRMVFYPAVIGFILLGIWISQLLYRFDLVKRSV